MDANTIITTCATAVAVGSLWASTVQARAVKVHNRTSVMPHLQIRQVKNYENGRTGLQVLNVGLGPALVTRSTVKLDGVPVGQWNWPTFQTMAADWPQMPNMYALFAGVSFPMGDCQYLIHLDDYDEARHAWFWELVAGRLSIEIEYESFYRGDNLKAVPPAL
ncbi:hypothetical protein ABZY81_39055 [Streptomyces sp. NPDC006514]|uniref:hypothetical protein n=1 Tax=Streptomyces sp. NPDC006514 TaxID=3154308 RepID=UPI0033A70603